MVTKYFNEIIGAGMERLISFVMIMEVLYLLKSRRVILTSLALGALRNRSKKEADCKGCLAIYCKQKLEGIDLRFDVVSIFTLPIKNMR